MKEQLKQHSNTEFFFNNINVKESFPCHCERISPYLQETSEDPHPEQRSGKANTSFQDSKDCHQLLLTFAQSGVLRVLAGYLISSQESTLNCPGALDMGPD